MIYNQSIIDAVKSAVLAYTSKAPLDDAGQPWRRTTAEWSWGVKGPDGKGTLDPFVLYLPRFVAQATGETLNFDQLMDVAAHAGVARIVERRTRERQRQVKQADGTMKTVSYTEPNTIVVFGGQRQSTTDFAAEVERAKALQQAAKK